MVIDKNFDMAMKMQANVLYTYTKLIFGKKRNHFKLSHMMPSKC